MGKVSQAARAALVAGMVAGAMGTITQPAAADHYNTGHYGHGGGPLAAPLNIASSVVGGVVGGVLDILTPHGHHGGHHSGTYGGHQAGHFGGPLPYGGHARRGYPSVAGPYRSGPAYGASYGHPMSHPIGYGYPPSVSHGYQDIRVYQYGPPHMGAPIYRPYGY